VTAARTPADDRLLDLRLKRALERMEERNVAKRRCGICKEFGHNARKGTKAEGAGTGTRRALGETPAMSGPIDSAIGVDWNLTRREVYSVKAEHVTRERLIEIVAAVCREAKIAVKDLRKAMLEKTTGGTNGA
jgi:hypothetical protein